MRIYHRPKTAEIKKPNHIDKRTIDEKIIQIMSQISTKKKIDLQANLADNHRLPKIGLSKNNDFRYTIKELYDKEIIRYHYPFERVTSQNRYLEFKLRPESLAIPLYVNNVLRNIDLPIEEIVGKPGNLIETHGHLNRFKFMISFYLNGEYPTDLLFENPQGRTVKEIIGLTGIAESSVRKQYQALKDFIISLPNGNSQFEYVIQQPLSELRPKRKEAKQRYDRLLQTKKFDVGSTVNYDDFTNAFTDNELNESKNKQVLVSMFIHRLKKLKVLRSKRVDQGTYYLNHKGIEIANSFVSLYKAIISDDYSQIESLAYDMRLPSTAKLMQTF